MKRAMVVGLGGLGCPAALALAALGVRRFVLVDGDRVELSNLHRQLLHDEADIGRLKVESARDKLTARFARLEAQLIHERVTAKNVLHWMREVDVVVDGTDDTVAKFALSDAAVATGKPVVYGGAVGWNGQAMTLSREGVCLRCVFEVPPEVATCAQAGILGPCAGFVGTWQGRLAWRALTEPRPEKRAQMWRFDGLALIARSHAVSRAGDCQHGD
ncbi:MAG: HesA/MoeB/ThiF family protein [Myxococcaceae bacterium]